MKSFSRFLKKYAQKIHVSYNDVCEAYDRVQDDLIAWGLLWEKSALTKVPVYWKRDDIGIFFSECARKQGTDEELDLRDFSVEGYYDPTKRRINIPEWGWWIDRDASVLDTLRHEFGHALAEAYPSYFRGPTFTKAFGGRYGVKCVETGETKRWWKDHFVSAYASQSTQEDFAETFMLFLKHNGRLPKRFSGRPVIRKKWDAVKNLITRIDEEPLP